MQSGLIRRKCDLRLEDVLIYGDPHGQWEPLLEAVVPSASTVVILGDLAEAKWHPEQVDDARRALATLSEWGVNWHMISGNHDTDTPEVCDLVFHEFSDRLVDGRTFRAGGVRMAGLGGVVRGKIWDGTSPPKFLSPEELLARTPRQERHRGGLSIRHRSTIFPSTVDTFAAQQADVLISHEAPSCHRHGFAFIDRLAEAMGARLIVHGHHHESYEDQLPNGVLVKGVGLAEVWRPQPATTW